MLINIAKKTLYRQMPPKKGVLRMKIMHNIYENKAKQYIGLKEIKKPTLSQTSYLS